MLIANADLPFVSRPRIRLARADGLAIVLLLVSALLIRLMFVNTRSLWFDEIFSVELARLSWRDVLNQLGVRDTHPPLYYLVLKVWIMLGRTPEIVRAPSVVFGALTTVPAYLLGSRLQGRLLGILSGIIVASSAFAIQASTEARMYPLLGLLTTWGTFVLWVASHTAPRPRLWLAYAAIMGLAVYVHYFAFLVLAAHAIYALGFCRTPHRTGAAFLASVAVVGLLYLPWWPTAAQQLGRFNPAWTEPMRINTPLNIFASSSFGGYFLGLGGYLVQGYGASLRQALLVSPFVIVAVLGGLRLRQDPGIALVVLSWLVPVGSLVTASLVRGVLYAFPRYVAFVEPFFAILLAQGIIALGAKVRRKVVTAVAVLFVVSLNLVSLRLSSVDASYQPYNWAGAAAHVRTHWQQGDVLVFYPHTARLAFGYYFEYPIRGVTLFPPRASESDLTGGLVAALASVRPAPRIWVVVTSPTPPGTVELLLNTLNASHRVQGVVDFGAIWVFQYAQLTQ